MATVHSGKRWEQSLGDNSYHQGTKEYLEAIGATIIPETAKTVDSRLVNQNGCYIGDDN